MTEGALWEYFDRGILIDNPEHANDYRRVHQFAQFKSLIHHHTHDEYELRDRESFEATNSFLPEDFFGYFNAVLQMVDLAPVLPSLDRSEVRAWNRRDFLEDIVERVENLLDEGVAPRLIPTLVLMFHRLAWERKPKRAELKSMLAIVAPGARTFDRAVEAFRIYLQCGGRAKLIATGNAPYWDDFSGTIITESEAYSAFWRMHGVPSNRIIAEPEAKDTEENARFLNVELVKILGERRMPRPRLLIVTSPYHLARFRLNVHLHLTVPVEVFAQASTPNRYLGPEYYFYDDPKAGLGRRNSLSAVFSEYLKIAFTISTMSLTPEQKRLLDAKA